ncbi:hypothetical protein HG531_007071 [Fusarium graminearum]|nr:hypothetical protein HG531_007071 [Fusarium graminearum]
MRAQRVNEKLENEVEEFSHAPTLNSQEKVEQVSDLLFKHSRVYNSGVGDKGKHGLDFRLPQSEVGKGVGVRDMEFNNGLDKGKTRVFGKKFDGILCSADVTVQQL